MITCKQCIYCAQRAKPITEWVFHCPVAGQSRHNETPRRCVWFAPRPATQQEAA